MEAFQLRLWDGRLGRWLSPDPMGQYSSPYLGMGNNPIGMIDPDGGLAGPGDPPQSWFGRVFSSIGSAFSGNSEVTYNEGQLKEVVIQGRGTSSITGTFGPALPNSAIAPSRENDYWWNKMAYDGSRVVDYKGFRIGVNDKGFAVENLGPIPLGGAGALGYISGGAGAKGFVSIYTGIRNEAKYIGQTVNIFTRYSNKIRIAMGLEVKLQVPARLANAVEQQLISVHGLEKYGNGLANNKRLQMSLANQIKNKTLMNEAMIYLDTHFPQWMTW